MSTWWGTWRKSLQESVNFCLYAAHRTLHSLASPHSASTNSLTNPVKLFLLASNCVYPGVSKCLHPISPNRNSSISRCHTDVLPWNLGSLLSSVKVVNLKYAWLYFCCKDGSNILSSSLHHQVETESPNAPCFEVASWDNVASWRRYQTIIGGLQRCKQRAMLHVEQKSPILFEPMNEQVSLLSGV